jgi:hypothetical protein
MFVSPGEKAVSGQLSAKKVNALHSAWFLTSGIKFIS